MKKKSSKPVTKFVLFRYLGMTDQHGLAPNSLVICKTDHEGKKYFSEYAGPDRILRGYENNAEFKRKYLERMFPIPNPFETSLWGRVYHATDRYTGEVVRVECARGGCWYMLTSGTGRSFYGSTAAFYVRYKNLEIEREY